MQIITFLGFTILVAVIAYLKTRNTDEDSSDGYFLGGRSLTGVVIAGSLLLTNLSTEQIVGLNGAAYKEGILVMAWETLAAIAMVITAVFLLPRYLKGGITTVPQFLERRYDKMTKTITSGLFLTGYAVILLPIVLYSGALAINSMFSVPELLGVSKNTALWITVWGIGIIGSIYAIFGGLKAVAVSDLINAVGLLIGGLLIPFFGLMAIGDGSVSDGIATLINTNPEKFNSIGGPESSIPFATIFTGMMLVQLFYWGTNQAIIQRALGAKNLKEGQKGLLLASFIKILGPLIVVLPGIIAYHMFGDTLENPDEAYPMLVTKVLPEYLVGFFAAVLFGAILSSFNSALNSSVTLFGIDIYQSYINKEASEKQVVWAGKKFGIGLAIISMCIAPLLIYASDGLFGYLQEVNGIYSIPILTIIVVGYLTKYVPAIAAKVGVISGSILYIISQFILKPMVGEENYPHFLHVMAILFVLNIVIMLLIGKFKPRAVAYKQVYTKQVDITPWKYLKVTGIAVCVIVIGIYIYFAQ
ncbi:MULTISPECIES: solute:sodium symporter family transporter [unclassified Polaribacter]|uniref:solute:sodium symporter family transporter n=1 Tax=unclassified Polaribacter TaxID=196858 RepID=UPI0011BDD834|nr:MULTISPECIES: solute:sodium symporter family transporter [unclassified Polaribacter]TXD51353.1 solute:sodium symporter family transporter [Polaribacter sp. IC063]TXD61987.1 solute:sodium symporter family transporter [Polaribacter sp. IC066]